MRWRYLAGTSSARPPAIASRISGGSVAIHAGTLSGRLLSSEPASSGLPPLGLRFAGSWGESLPFLGSFWFFSALPNSLRESRASCS